MGKTLDDWCDCSRCTKYQEKYEYIICIDFECRSKCHCRLNTTKPTNLHVSLSSPFGYWIETIASTGFVESFACFRIVRSPNFLPFQVWVVHLIRVKSYYIIIFFVFHSIQILTLELMMVALDQHLCKEPRNNFNWNEIKSVLLPQQISGMRADCH